LKNEFIRKRPFCTKADSVYIDLSELPGAENREISEGIVLDYDVHGHWIRIDIDNATARVKLERLIVGN